jgi:hypothetical protein
MPEGKPAGVRCVQLDEYFLCRLFGRSERPALCAAFAAEEAVCGDSQEQALARIQVLEIETA